MDPAAILPVADMLEAIAFYEAIGLQVESYDETYAFVAGEGTALCHLRLINGLSVAANHAALYVHVGDADAIHELVVATGIASSDVDDMPWGMREFSLTDPSGNLIRVGHSLHHEHDH